MICNRHEMTRTFADLRWGRNRQAALAVGRIQATARAPEGSAAVVLEPSPPPQKSAVGAKHPLKSFAPTALL